VNPSKLTKYQRGWLAGRDDARQGKPMADVRPPKQSAVGAPPMWAGQARLGMGDDWADGYAHGWASQQVRTVEKLAGGL